MLEWNTAAHCEGHSRHGALLHRTPTPHLFHTLPPSSLLSPHSPLPAPFSSLSSPRSPLFSYFSLLSPLSNTFSFFRFLSLSLSLSISLSLFPSLSLSPPPGVTLIGSGEFKGPVTS